MKKYLFLVFYFVFIIVCPDSFAQHSKPAKYIIDPSVTSLVKANIANAILQIPDSIRDGFRSAQMEMGAWELREYINGKLDTAGGAAPIPIMAAITGDTIQIIGLDGFPFPYGIGFQLTIFKGLFNSEFIKNSDRLDGDIKLTPSDPEFTSNMQLQSSKQSLKLASKPSFRWGAAVDGELEFTTADFYVKNNDGLDQIRLQVKAFFHFIPEKPEKRPVPGFKF